MRLPGLIVFDLDGTLVDTGPDLTASLNHALGLLGRPPVDEHSVREMVGLGARKLLERGLDATGGGTPELVEEGFQPFLDHYAANICVGSRAYDGLDAVLDAIDAAGSRMAVCTNKPQALSELLVEAIGWGGRFAAVVGGDSVPEKKPHPQHLLATIERAGGDPRDTVYIGDSIIDVTTAKAAGVPVIAVSFGFPDRPADTLGADVVVDHYDELLAVLHRYGRLPAA